MHTYEIGSTEVEESYGYLTTHPDMVPAIDADVKQLKVNYINELYTLTTQYEPIFVQTLKNIAQSVGLQVNPQTVICNQKPPESACRKRNAKDGEWCTDILRESIVFQNLDQLMQAVIEINRLKIFTIVSIEDRITFKGKPKKSGYRDMNILLKTTEGFIIELQLHLPETLQAKIEVGDPIYHQRREVECEIKTLQQMINKIINSYKSANIDPLVDISEMTRATQTLRTEADNIESGLLEKLQTLQQEIRILEDLEKQISNAEIYIFIQPLKKFIGSLEEKILNLQAAERAVYQKAQKAYIHREIHRLKELKERLTSSFTESGWQDEHNEGMVATMAKIRHLQLQIERHEANLRQITETIDQVTFV